MDIDISAIQDGDGAILPTWTAVDCNNVRTSRELWEYMRNEGWHVEVSIAIRDLLFKVLNMAYISIIGELVSVCADQVLKFCLLAYRFHSIARLKYVFLHFRPLSLST
jgi:hypothetical protein